MPPLRDYGSRVRILVSGTRGPCPELRDLSPVSRVPGPWLRDADSEPRDPDLEHPKVKKISNHEKVQTMKNPKI